MRESKKLRLGHVATPTIALVLAAALPSCGTNSCGSAESSGTEESVTSEVEVDDVSEWIGENGELIGDCSALCRLAGAHEDGVADETCIVHSVSPPADGAGGQGGAGGGSGSDGAIIDVTCDYTGFYYCEGRRHACWQDAPQGTGRNAIGAWLGRAASAEAGSVHSFHRLVRELERFGAPAELIDRAKGAMRDEVAHARMMTRLAGDWGGRAQAIEVAPVEERSLFELALENATEGCSKETFAALIALHQAEHAQERGIADCMRHIAEDEMRHGQLAWDLHAWFLARLSREEAEQINQALALSLEELGRSPVRERMNSEQRQVLGLPDSHELPGLASRLNGLLRPSLAAA